MTKKRKLSILILMVSLLLPIFAYKIKVPEFLNPVEIQIIQFTEPSGLEFVEKKSAYEGILQDPFKLSEKGIPQKDLATRILPNLTLTYSGKNRYAIIGDKIVREGEKVGDFKVVKILKDKVLIRDKKGETVWLKLEDF